MDPLLLHLKKAQVGCPHHIEWTKQERLLLGKIARLVHDVSHVGGHAAYNGNREPILVPVKSLSERRTVPAMRLSYWNDLTYNPGKFQVSCK